MEKPNQTVYRGQKIWSNIHPEPLASCSMFVRVCVDAAGLYKHTVHEDMMSFKYTQAAIFLHIRQQSVLSVLGATCLNSS